MTQELAPNRFHGGINNNLICFDMDGVLVDVSRSYREAVRMTASLFIAGEKEPSPPLFNLADLQAVKMKGGLNNDWDLTAYVIRLLLSLVHDIEKAGAHGNMLKEPDIDRPWNIEPVLKFASDTERSLFSLDEENGAPEIPLVNDIYGSNNIEKNIIKRMFQEIYLGEVLFRSVYGISPVYHKERGLIDREKPLFKAEYLKALSKNNVLAVATGRPKAEADHGLVSFGFSPFFSDVMTHDHCEEEERKRLIQNGKYEHLGKPNPYMLLTLHERFKPEKAFYIGDMPDDMVAAKNTGGKYVAVGILHTISDENEKMKLKAALIKAGADHVLNDARELISLLS